VALVVSGFGTVLRHGHVVDRADENKSEPGIRGAPAAVVVSRINL